MLYILLSQLLNVFTVLRVGDFDYDPRECGPGVLKLSVGMPLQGFLFLRFQQNSGRAPIHDLGREYTVPAVMFGGNGLELLVYFARDRGREDVVNRSRHSDNRKPKIGVVVKAAVSLDEGRRSA